MMLLLHYDVVCGNLESEYCYYTMMLMMAGSKLNIFNILLNLRLLLLENTLLSNVEFYGLDLNLTRP